MFNYYAFLQRINPIYFGILAIFIWSWSSLLINYTKLPALEVLALSLLTALLISISKISIKKEWHLYKYPIKTWLNLSLSLGLNNVCYYLAFQYASAATVDLITWLWPVIFILIIRKKHKAIISGRIYVSLAIGLIAAFLMIPNYNLLSNYSFLGLVFAMLANIFWCNYLLINLKHPKISPDFTVLCLGLNFPIIAYLHFVFEPSITPSILDISRIVMLGLGSLTTAFYLWDYASKHSSSIKLSIYSYITPVLSVVWLVCFKMQIFNIKLLWALILLIVCNMLCHNEQSNI